jgi:hypothetical protein
MDNLKQIFDNYYSTNKRLFTRPPNGHAEVKITSELARILGCRTEVQAYYGLGRIDCLSKDWLIEAKYEGTTAEKGALGQLLLYSYSLKFKGSLGLALIGSSGRSTPGILRFCQSNNIIIFYYNLNTLKWSVYYDGRKTTK